MIERELAGSQGQDVGDSCNRGGSCLSHHDGDDDDVPARSAGGAFGQCCIVDKGNMALLVRWRESMEEPIIGWATAAGDVYACSVQLRAHLCCQGWTGCFVVSCHASILLDAPAHLEETCSCCAQIVLCPGMLHVKVVGRGVLCYIHISR